MSEIAFPQGLSLKDHKRLMSQSTESETLAKVMSSAASSSVHTVHFASLICSILSCSTIVDNL